MFKLLVRTALNLNFLAVIRAAIKLEYGAGIFCARLAARADDEGYFGLSGYLHEQQKEEDSHARMLGAIVDGGNRIKRNCDTGLWRKGGYYEAFDGISERYWSAKLFFWFHKAETFSWADTLAFMIVIEEFVVEFYEVLIEFLEACSAKLDINSAEFDFCQSMLAIAHKIRQDEIEQVDKLALSLGSIHLDPQILVSQWRLRSFLAFLGAIADLFKIPAR